MKKSARKVCIFCDFISGKRKTHQTGLPFLILDETKESISFLAEDQPQKETQVLVIPKAHYEGIAHLPSHTLLDLINHVMMTSSLLKQMHDGCNILINEGKAAGQCVMHTHVHVISRSPKDGIAIELWKRKNLSVAAFRKRHGRILKGRRDE